MDLQNQVILVIMLATALPSSGQLDDATPTIRNTSVTETEIQICEAYQCRGKEQCRGNEDSFVCSCDKKCALYHDCCWTADGNCRDRIKLHGVATNTKICTYTHSTNIQSRFDQQPTRVGYFMIATCPSHYPDNYVKNRCHEELPLLPQPLEEYIHHVPVLSYKNKGTYKNVYCAKCNDVDYEDMRFWHFITATCDSSQPSAECDDVTFIPSPEIYDNVPLPRKCALSDPIKCSSSSPLYEQCMSYSAVISVMGMTFRNPHCALCYNDGLFFNEKEFCPFEVDTVLNGGAFGPKIPHIVPFDFSIFDEKNVSFKNVTCSRGLLYNSSSKMCDFAPGSTIISISDCPRKSCSEITVRFELKDKKLPMWQSTKIIDTLKETTNRYFSIPLNDVYSYTGQNNNILLIFRLINSSETFEEFYQAVNRFSRDVIEYHKLPIELSDIVVNCSSCFPSELCRKSSWFERSQVVLFTHEGITSARIDNLNRVFSDITWYVTSLGECTDNNTCERNITVIICDWLQERPLCPFRIFTNNSYSLEKNENGTLYLLSDLIEGAVSPIDYVILTNGNACVCSEYYKEKVNLIILILSIVFTGLSLVSLVLTFVTYCTFKSLRNLPGKITMNFVVSLFFAQIILIPATFSAMNHTPCHMIGILGHYLWLSTFLWMSVVAYDVSRTFGMKSSTLNPVSNNTKTFLIYFIIGWGAPCVFVILCVIVQLLHIQNLRFAYVNADDNCWLSPPRANFILFGIPVILCLSFNYVNFIFTVRGLHRSKKNAKKVNGQTSSHQMMKQEIFLVLKVSILMGLCWIWAILYGFFQDNAVFFYLHSILNPLQGFFVFCIYVCNKRVLSMWRDTLRKLCSQSESTTRQYTRSTDSNSRSNVRTSSTVL
ncbi:G-protein coupled receptor Mth2 [Holothuria leucospilota]|uniref:G-protein coupled receptor Mth2 n=1 Tax=Holothuria leucospilota TaxID=206669 RepID=A0A9Q0YDX5_HOLLE|nr:G-protein coupled receptor Mth2 [Holothuria leucospilota]